MVIITPAGSKTYTWNEDTRLPKEADQHSGPDSPNSPGGIAIQSIQWLNCRMFIQVMAAIRRHILLALCLQNLQVHRLQQVARQLSSWCEPASPKPAQRQVVADDTD